MIEIFDINPYHFYKIIEVFIKAEDGLSRDIIKHLNHVSNFSVLQNLTLELEAAAFFVNVSPCMTGLHNN